MVEDSDAVRWVTSLVVALVVVWVSLVMRRGRERAETAAVEAEESTRQAASIQTLTSALSSAVTPSDVAQRARPAHAAAHRRTRGRARADRGRRDRDRRPLGPRTSDAPARPPAAADHEGADRESGRRGRGQARERPRVVRARLPGRGDAVSVRAGGTRRAAQDRGRRRRLAQLPLRRPEARSTRRPTRSPPSQPTSAGRRSSAPACTSASGSGGRRSTGSCEQRRACTRARRTRSASRSAARPGVRSERTSPRSGASTRTGCGSSSCAGYRRTSPSRLTSGSRSPTFRDCARRWNGRR